jgi:hypothetical protein
MLFGFLLRECCVGVQLLKTLKPRIREDLNTRVNMRSGLFKQTKIMPLAIRKSCTDNCLALFIDNKLAF